MSDIDPADRWFFELLADLAGINAQLAQAGRLPESDWTKLSHAMGALLTPEEQP